MPSFSRVFQQVNILCCSVRVIHACCHFSGSGTGGLIEWWLFLLLEKTWDVGGDSEVRNRARVLPLLSIVFTKLKVLFLSGSLSAICQTVCCSVSVCIHSGNMWTTNKLVGAASFELFNFCGFCASSFLEQDLCLSSARWMRVWFLLFTAGQFSQQLECYYCIINSS